MNIVITGGSSGLGREMVKHFENKGNLVHSYTRKYSTGEGYDLSKQDGRFNLIKNVRKSFNYVDLLVNNAGVMILDEEKMSMADMIRMVHLNLVAVWDLTVSLYPLLKAARGQIINIASVSGVKGDDECPLYAATKAGVINLTKSFAKKYAPKVRVNCISPGFYNTNLVPGPAPQELIDGVPLAREAVANEIIPVIEYLLQNRYSTGANIVTDGGLTVA